jgi:hypothetical protein
MKKEIVLLALLSLASASASAVMADDVAKGKAPFMTEMDNGRKFYVKKSKRFQLPARSYRIETIQVNKTNLVPTNR